MPVDKNSHMDTNGSDVGNISYVLLRCRVAVYIFLFSNVSVQDKVFFFGSKHHGTNKR